MRSTFFGFEIARSGIMAAQTGLDVTGENMANMSTEGYARRQVRQSTTITSQGGMKIATYAKASVEMGVTVDGIRQIRDQFYDVRFRDAAAESGLLDKQVAILTDIRGVVDETQTDGLNVMLEELYDSLQGLSGHAGDVHFSGITRSAAQKVAKTLNEYSERLDGIAEQEMYDLSVNIKEVNGLLEKVNRLNDTIKTETMRGNETNALNDTRNLYLDRLSTLIGAKPESHTDGTVSITAGGATLLDAKTGTASVLSVEGAPGSVGLKADGVELTITGGTVQGGINGINGSGAYAGAGSAEMRGIMYYKNALDDFARALSGAFNEQNKLGGVDKPLFTGTGAADIAISDAWMADANYITSSDSGENNGESENILRMIALFDQDADISPYFKGKFQEFTLALMIDAGTDLNYESDIAKTASMVKTAVDNQRESVMGVNVNEETANMLRYQKAFEASSRFMTVLDEMLDTIINRMGVVGR